MFLKRLDTVGFKSFAERISVDFVPGVTAVVGPNGSGKSNITDAIRWVLGEQSAKSLRGSKMEDIIFQGSDSRKALNIAEVTLTLDNSDQTLALDYNEVSVTRRVYRSGESEFLINKQSCRLKDIIDLFMDSGLGREAFSIISQGKVEEILSSKAEERRSIFEEAAGVLKYKQRKKKAEYKLAETQENLNRIEDIIYEIDGQLEPLKEQAAVAQDFLQKKDELKEVEISLLIAEIEELHTKWKALLSEIEVQKQKEIEMQTSIQQKQANLEEGRSQIQALDESIEELQESLLDLTQQLENLEGKKQLINERHKHFQDNKSKLEEENGQLRERSETLKNELDSENEKLAAWEREKQETRESLKQTAKQLSATGQNIEEQIEELKSEYIERLNEQAAKRNERQSIAKQLEQIGMKKNSQQDKFKGLISEREKLEAQLEELQAELKGRTEKRKAAEQEFEKQKKALESDKANYQELQTKLYQGYQYIEKLKSKKEMLEDMKEGFQGFFQGVKEILKARQESEIAGIEGAVIELIDVPADYISAIETALGGQAQHVVVEDEAKARAAINWLKKNNKGRATFLPITAIKPKFIPGDLMTSAKNHPGFVGIGSDLVKHKNEHQSIVRNLLGNVVIADNLKNANEIAVKLQRKFRIVTLEGDVINPGGAMTGGAQKKNSQSLFSREKDLQDITKKLADFETKASAFEKQVKDRKQSNEDLERSMEKQREAIKIAEQEEQDSISALKEVEIKVSHYNENLKLYDQDTNQYETDLADLKRRESGLANELSGIEAVLKEIQKKIDDLNKQQSDHQQNQDKLQSKHHQLEVTMAEQEAQVNSQKEKCQSLERQYTETYQSLQDNIKQLQQIYEFQNNAETEQEIDEKLLEKRRHKEKVTQLIQARRQERSDKTERMNDQEREIKEKNRLYQSIAQDLQDKELKAARFDVELENRLNHLQNEYSLSFEKARQTYKKAEDVEQTKQSVKLIKRSIEELGTVNLGAIDEYERILERYEFLTDQQTDLVQAKDTLFGVISEMDGEMVRRFEATFTQIKEEFSTVFHALFGGGNAELKLTEPDNLLETGVDIIARPPGKKLQHLGLLSGGERALTAIALLFAILRVRPVPFCVLDEVEAALDDANVNRFARYLKEFSEKTQFIVITHRKGTMEEADVLYGVTMQESGVSRLVSVRLEDAPELVKA
ncbi:chromosome segregation protein SMC [Sediminibacillus albus]|uniref:Chromosome partition protein Smc n=1 Tax=Sediminibacillus albus TaxID=407036 RepID=A0A1G8W634_9BACI|nr:chromosome segregation protein SMC [Sediminibacillus albus]SDJ72980.1 condensin subunit Smc [Sediminibacillus albus]